LHHALQTTLGSHAQQRGSKVADDWLRFDFANMTGVAAPDLLTIEQLVNQRVQENASVAAEILPLAAARERGAMMLFGEKYPDPVRMVSMGNFSRELCGGTHVTATGEIQVLEIQAEEGVSAGTRRIEALTGAKAQEFRTAVHREIDEICRLLSCSPAQFPAAITERLQQARELKKQLTSGRSATTTPKKTEPPHLIATDYVAQRNALKESARALNVGMFAVAQRLQQLQEELAALQQQLQTQTRTDGISVDELIQSAQTVAGVPIIVQELVVTNPAQLRQLVDEVRQRLSSVALFLAAALEADKVVLVAAVTNDVIQRGLKSGDWVKQIAPLVGGNGGGKPDFAQAGGKQPENIRPALAAALDYVRGLWQS
jgi:alanyl-tRNA synthetase